MKSANFTESMFRNFLVFLLLFSTVKGFSQTTYGNDWINFSQTYYKIKISKDGVYRITQKQLAQAGMPVNSVDPRNIQIFNKGKEIPLFVTGDNDGKFDDVDYLEFFGEKNDGKLDKILYTNPADQPHDYYSLYTDTASYFITWTVSTPGKRFLSSAQAATGLTPEPYFLYTALSYFTDGGYYPGAYILAETSQSEYTEGEGILGASFNLGASQTRTVATPGLYSSAADGIIGEVFVAGRSNATSSAAFNHHLRVEVSNNGAFFIVKKDTSFSGYSSVRPRFALSHNELGSITTFKFSAVNDLGATTDYQAPGYIKITYPRSLDLQGISSLRFNLKGFQPGNSSYLRFKNASLTQPILLDLTNNRRIVGTQNLGIAEAVVPGAGQSKDIYLFDGTSVETAIPEPVSFTNFLASSPGVNYLIVTHQSLLPKANEYSLYRQQTGYNPLVVTTEQLYNQFYYGIHHPQAIRNFCKLLLDKGTVKPEYLLLLGKGQSHFYLKAPKGLEKDLVPGIGNPPSDNMFTSGLDGTGLEPAIATGRIAAASPEAVDIYLNKLKKYEQLPDSLWRKNFIHVSGGNDIFENNQWAGYENTFLKEAQTIFGAKAINYQKNVSQPVTDNLREKIVSSINDGASLLCFFGHGSAQATEINFGEPQELQNQNKPLVYLINGCLAGNPFTDTSIGEKFIFQPDKGAVGWLATSDEGVASYLGSFSTLFYRNSFNSNYGRSIAQNLRQTIKTYQNPGDALNLTHSRQFIWQGDPALKFYAPEKPDYYVRNTDFFIYPKSTSAASDSFAVAIILKNRGKVAGSPVLITVKHTLPDNSQITYPERSFPGARNTDTVYFYIKRENRKLGGLNRFAISIDPENTIKELDENNNISQFEYTMPSNDVNIIYPINYSIVSDNQIELKAQSSNLTIENSNYIFEIDTVKTFNSIWKKNSGILKAGALVSWKPGFNPQNKKVYYWRIKIQPDNKDESIWQESSFTFIDKSTEGWNQAHPGQFEDLTFAGVHYNTTSRKFEFDNTTFITSIQTKGDDNIGADEMAYRATPGGRLGYRGNEFIGFTLIALNPVTLETYTYPSAYNLEGYFKYSGEFLFNINNPVHLDSLINYIRNVPPGYHVLGYSGKGISLKDLPLSAKAAFATIGCSVINSVGAGEPYMFWGQKGANPGSAIEKTADHSSPVPPRSQLIKFEKEYYYPFTEGSLWSPTIGPSYKWKSLSYTFKNNPGDQIRFEVYGIKSNGDKTLLKIETGPTGELKLDDISPDIYSFLKIRAFLKNEEKRIPAQLAEWKILYDAYPEGSLNPSLKNNFYSSTINEGDSVKWQIAYQNLSNRTTDSVKAFITLMKPDRSSATSVLKTFRPLNPGDTINVNTTLPTLGLSGENALKIELKPLNDKDLFSFNNYLTQYFTVVRDSRPPLVNVLFDGRSITNGELISPKPDINISVLDENKYLLLTDTSNVEVYWKNKQADDSQFRREYYSSNRLIFTPATSTTKNRAVLQYLPEQFPDGSYTLKIRSKDASGNFNQVNDYQIDFEVVNEATISNFYPYPNPFTTKMKFVFTLTGEKVPDKLKIQILTATGKIVREVTKEELGALRIGNNISEFSWDGTDQFGDRLANGVYFYRVIVENNDRSSIRLRETSGDRFFKNGYGKIYIMR